MTPQPSRTPLPADQVTFDLQSVDLPGNVSDGIDGVRVIFITQNDRDTVTNLSTAQPTNTLQTVYLASPTIQGNRVPLIEIRTTTGEQVFPSPRGNALAYFVPDVAPGIYILDITLELVQRIVALPSLMQRGVFSAPNWHPDGTRIAVTRENGYELDIYTYEPGSGLWENVTVHPAMDYAPVYSPDGRYLAFLSDRSLCPSWLPGDPAACDPDNDSFVGGQVHVLDTLNGTVARLSDILVTEVESLRWINNRQLVFAGGDPLALLEPSRTLWLADVARETAQQVPTLTDLSLSDAWSPDGTRVLYQAAGDTSRILVSDLQGEVIATIDDVGFARFGMVADWSSDGANIALGGSGGQCPFGIRVLDGATYRFVTRGQTPPSMCGPIYSPDGQFVAYTGINPSVADGRSDIYVAAANGRGAVNLTVDLRGESRLIGWVAP